MGVYEKANLYNKTGNFSSILIEILHELYRFSRVVLVLYNIFVYNCCFALFVEPLSKDSVLPYEDRQ